MQHSHPSYGNVCGGRSRTGSGYNAAAAPTCRQVPRQECQNIPRKQCTTVSRENYRNVLKQKCRTVPGQSCWNVTRKVPRQECKHIVVESAQSLLTSSAVTAPSRCTAVFLISNAEVCLSRSLERFQDNSAAQFRNINAILSKIMMQNSQCFLQTSKNLQKKLLQIKKKKLLQI